MAIFVSTEPALQTNSVGTSATQIFQISGTLPDETSIPSSFADSQDVTVINQGPEKIYVGQSGVTDSTGLPVAVGDQLTLQGPVINLYAITASGTSEVVAGLASVVSVV